MSYDAWKTRSPDDELPGVEAPEIFVECSECCGEGSIEIWESVSRWSIDPPCAHCVPCRACNGSGGHIEEAPGDFT